jgi:hypothetical protein
MVLKKRHEELEDNPLYYGNHLLLVRLDDEAEAEFSSRYENGK